MENLGISSPAEFDTSRFSLLSQGAEAVGTFFYGGVLFKKTASSSKNLLTFPRRLCFNIVDNYMYAESMGGPVS